MGKNAEGTVETVAVAKGISDLTPYLEELEYDRDVFIRETRHYCEMAVTGMLEAGRRLICLKMMEGHGHFEAALDEIGIPQQRANELMSIAYFVRNKLLGKSPDSGDLKRLNTMGKTRLLLLSRIPDDVQEQFSGDDILGMKIDEVAAIPLEQLRDMVRELRDAVKNGHKQVRRLQEEKDKIQKDYNNALGVGSSDGKAAEELSMRMFSQLIGFTGMIAPQNFRKDVFGTPEGAACLKKVDHLFSDLFQKWIALMADLGVAD